MAYNIILPGAWELTELTQDVQYELFSLQVPTAWQQVAKSFALKRFKLLGKGYPSVPVYSLDPLIVASFPQIIQTVRYGWQRPGTPWLLATEPANLSDLSVFIKDWLREEFSNLDDSEIESSLDRLPEEAWHWDEPATYPLNLKPEKRSDLDIRFQAIPDYLALEFLRNPIVSFGENNQYQLTFYRVVSLKQGAELMSWPPYRVPLIKRNEQVGTADISFVIHFKLQTVPWRNEPVIYHQLSVRRWITKSQELDRLPYRGVTVFIGDNRRWLDGVRQPFCFMPLPLKKRPGGEPQWSRAISELLQLNDSPLPDPNTLASSPAYKWSEFGSYPVGIQAAFAYDTRHRGEPPCLPGVSPLDLASLDRAIQNKVDLEGFPVSRVGEAVKISKPPVSLWKPEKSNNEADDSPKNRNALATPMLRPKLAAPAVFRSTENPIHSILILWETKECRDALIAEICNLLELSPKGEAKIYETPTGVKGEETIYEGALGSLRIKTQHIQGLAQKLDLDNPSVKGKNRQQRRIDLLNERIPQITLSLPKPSGLCGALIEIQPKEHFKTRPESDPKLALRIGAMQAGYVNQHIHKITARKKSGEEYEPKSSSERVMRAVSDLLRQFGILPDSLIDPKKDGIDPNLWLTCFYVERRTRKTTASNTPSTVALMVRVNPVTGIVQVTTPSLFPTKSWVSYPEGLEYLISEKWNPDSYEDETTGDIGEEQPSSDKRREQQFLNKFITDCLRDCLSTSIEKEKSPRVLFMLEAQNARKMLTWLQNPKLPANDLPDELKRHMTESERSRLLVVRLRVANNGEVPCGIVDGSPGGKTYGLFRWQDVCDDGETALYLSIRQPLNTEQGTNILQKKQSRLDDGIRLAGNPRLLEIAIVYHPENECDKLACFVHDLRSRWPYYANTTCLPFPFPFASLAKEYAVSAKDIPLDEEDEDADSNEEEEPVQLSLDLWGSQ